MTRVFSWGLNLVYTLILVVCAPFIIWTALRTKKYREGFAEKICGLVPPRQGENPCLWLHAVSVGEVNLIGTLLAEIRTRHPDWDMVLSTTTKTGFDLARRKYRDLPVFYCPLDFSWAVRTAMRRIRPSALVLVELELWPNLIWAAEAHGATVAIVNGRLSDGSFRGYRRLGPLIARLLKRVHLIAAQDHETARRFRTLGANVDAVRVTGSLKYDGAETDRGNRQTRRLQQLAGIGTADIVFLAGSTQEPEEKYALEIYRRLSHAHPQLRLILVPRHPERFDAVAKLLEDSDVSWRRRSELTHEEPLGGRQPIDDAAKRPVLLVDSVGELGAWWGASHIALVGGSFGSRGGQNMIEPAAYGAAVAFGPHTENFRDVVAALLAVDAATVTQDATELEVFVRRCLEDPQYAQRLGHNARRLVASQLGATDRTCQLLENILARSDRRLAHVHAVRSASAA